MTLQTKDFGEGDGHEVVLVPACITQYQRWVLEEDRFIRQCVSGKYLSVTWHRPEDERLLIEKRDELSKNLQWRITKDGMITNRGTGRALVGSPDGTVLTKPYKHSDMNQQWMLIPDYGDPNAVQW
jgi:hypothetical protein